PFNLEVDLGESGELRGFPQFSEAEARLEYLYSTIRRYEEISPSKIKESDNEAPAEIVGFKKRLAEVLDDDLNTAQAIALLAGLLKAVNEMCDGAQGKKGSVSTKAYEAAGSALKATKKVLGLGLDDPKAFLTRVRDRRAVSQGIDCSWV